ncbi:MAG TPA: helix-turn-helix transcriptional regulator [Trebonia sp.]|jgi:transcriptional regulator with XRE-family HTH domain|nr:helix-turn-helix transcriptional regulator [Trebonia sp.]
MTAPPAFGGRVRQARTAKGWSLRQADLAAGVSEMAFRRAEDGRDVALSTAAEIARALGVSLDWLTGLTDVNEATEKLSDEKDTP